MAAAVAVPAGVDTTMETAASKSRILVVDDEPSVLLTYRLLLEQKGYAVTAVISAQDAIAKLQTREFDLLLCDLSLEEQRTGFDVIEFGRQRVPALPAALLTGYATVETAEKAENAAIAVLFKPIDIEQFFSTISVLLGDKTNGQAKTS